jgi:uncharacterized short protein YbdD (DUF466 family)
MTTAAVEATTTTTAVVKAAHLINGIDDYDTHVNLFGSLARAPARFRRTIG